MTAKVYIPFYLKIGNWIPLYTYLSRIIDSGFMKQIGTFRVKVSTSTDKKKTAEGTVKSYEYGSLSIRTPDLKEYIGKEVMVRVFIE